MAAGNLAQQLQLREKDQLQSLAKSLDSMRGSLREKIQTIQGDVAKILNTASNRGAPQELVEQLNHLQQNVENNFKV